MKYLITTICALAMAAALASCNNDGGTKPAPSVTPVPSATPGPQSKSAEDFDFRGANWGMSMAEVKKTERMKPKVEKEDSLTYDGKYKGILTQYNFKFKDDKLYRGGVLYITRQESPAAYMNNYEMLKKDITAVYGEPVIDGEKKTNPDAVIDPDNKAEAVCNGDMMVASQWDLPRSMVILMMNGNGLDCVTSLIYLDRDALHPIAEQDGQGSHEVNK